MQEAYESLGRPVETFYDVLAIFELAVRKRLKIQGFIVSDQWQRFGEYRAMAAPLVRNGELKYREDIVEGLDRAPEAFIDLLQGRNFGKLLIRLGDDPTTRV